MLKNYAIKISFILFGITILFIFSMFFFAVNVNALQTPTFQTANNNDPTNFAFGLNDDYTPYIPTLSEEQKQIIITYVNNNYTLPSGYSDYIILFQHIPIGHQNQYYIWNTKENVDLSQMFISVYAYNNLKLNSVRYYDKGYSDFRSLVLRNYDNTDTLQNFNFTYYNYNYNTNSISFSNTYSNSNKLPITFTSWLSSGYGQQYFNSYLIYNTNNSLTHIPIVSTGSSSYRKDTDFLLCDLEEQKCSAYLYGINKINEFPLSILSDLNIDTFDFVDMKDKFGVVFYFKDHNLPRKSQEFILNGWYAVSYYKKVFSELSSIYELIPNGDLELDYGDAIDNSLLINYSRHNHTWYDEVYYFSNKNSVNFNDETIFYNSTYFDYSYVNEDGSLSKDISFIDTNNEEQTISSIRIDYLPYYNNIKFFGVREIITLPLNFISSLSNSTCKPLVLPLLDNELTIPCMSQIYKDTLGVPLWTMFQTIFTGIVSYYVIVQFLIYIKEFKSPDTDKIEVIDL